MSKPATPLTSHGSLTAAKRAKNDEFYTQLDDIIKELKHYKSHFQGKVVLCNCDDPEWSNFWEYFKRSFEHLGLTKLVATHYANEKPSYKLEYLGEGHPVLKTPLQGDGDFRSPECVALLQEVDIVVTNPPFSLFREYLAQLVENRKQFLIIGSNNAITYKDVFRLLKSNEAWRGISAPKRFVQPDGSFKNFGNIGWFTNLSHQRRAEALLLYRTYSSNESDYPKYDNYDAIEVSRVSEIPLDFTGAMGVPITFLDKYNPKQFVILGMASSAGYREDVVGIPFCGQKDARPLLAGKNTYARVFIQQKTTTAGDLA
jgi:hypothetical protein